jgi:hypothetical protein
MTYFTKNIFQNILSYCDDRIERKQKKLKSNLLADLALFQEDQLSNTFQNIIDDNMYDITNYDDYINNEEITTTIMTLLHYTTYVEDYESNYDNELTENFLNCFYRW